MTDVYQYSKVLATFTVISIVRLLFSCTGKPSAGSSIPGRVSHCWVERKDHITWSVCNTFSNEVLHQTLSDFHMGGAHCWLMVRVASTRTSFCKATFQLVGSQSLLLNAIVPYQIKTLLFTHKFMEFLESHFCSEVSRSLWMVTRTTDVISHSYWFCIFSKYAVCALRPTIKIIKTGIKYCWINYWLL